MLITVGQKTWRSRSRLGFQRHHLLRLACPAPAHLGDGRPSFDEDPTVSKMPGQGYRPLLAPQAQEHYKLLESGPRLHDMTLEETRQEDPNFTFKQPDNIAKVLLLSWAAWALAECPAAARMCSKPAV